MRQEVPAIAVAIGRNQLFQEYIHRHIARPMEHLVQATIWNILRHIIPAQTRTAPTYGMVKAVDIFIYMGDERYFVADKVSKAK